VIEVNSFLMVPVILMVHADGDPDGAGGASSPDKSDH
jgi:hypothetical protein